MEASSTHDTAKPISSGNYASPNEITYNHLKQNKLFDGDLDDFNNDIINEEVRRNVYSIMTNDKKFDGSFYDFTVDLGITPTPLLSGMNKVRKNSEKKAAARTRVLEEYDKLPTWTKMFLGGAPTYGQVFPDPVRHMEQGLSANGAMDEFKEEMLTDSESEALERFYTKKADEQRQKEEENVRKANELLRQGISDYEALPWYAKFGRDATAASSVPMPVNTTLLGIETDTRFRHPEYDTYNAAARMHKDARNEYAAPSRYGSGSGIANLAKGAFDTVADPDWYTRGGTELIDQLAQYGTLSKMDGILEKAEKEKWSSETIADALEKSLNDGDKSLLLAMDDLQTARYSRQDDKSLAYQGGQGIVESMGYMFDFLATGQITNAAFRKTAAAAFKSLRRRLLKGSSKALSAMSKTARFSYGAGKFGIRAADASVKTAARTPLMLSTWNNVMDNRLELDENGRFKNSWTGAIANGITDSFLENLSEMSGPAMSWMLSKGLRVTGKALKFLSSPALKSAKVRKATTGLLDKIRTSGLATAKKEYDVLLKSLKELGYDGLVEEWMEEVFNAASMTAKGYITGDGDDQRAWSDFWDKDNQGILWMTLAFPILGGGGIRMAANGKAIARSIERERSYRERPWMRAVDERTKWSNYDTRSLVNTSTITQGGNSPSRTGDYREIDRTRGMVQVVRLSDGREVYVTNGHVETDEQGNILPDKSDKTLTVIDNNKKIVVPTGGTAIRAEKLVSSTPYAEVARSRAQSIFTEEKAKYTYKPGSSVVMVDPLTGVPLVNPDGTYATATVVRADEEHGGIILDTHDPSSQDPEVFYSYKDIFLAARPNVAGAGASATKDGDGGGNRSGTIVGEGEKAWTQPEDDPFKVGTSFGLEYNGRNMTFTVSKANPDGTYVLSNYAEDEGYIGSDVVTREQLSRLQAEAGGTQGTRQPQPAQGQQTAQPAQAKPAYPVGHVYTFTDENGETIEAEITAINPDGTYAVKYTDATNGNYIGSRPSVTEAEINAFSQPQQAAQAAEWQAQQQGAEQERPILSEETDENGLHFVIAPDGSLDFGQIDDGTGLQPAPIRLSEGLQNKNKSGYGFIHIDDKHGKEIKKAGFKSTLDFISFVAKHYDRDNIRVGKLRGYNGNPTFLIQVIDDHENTLYIELSNNGKYWTINSGGAFRQGYAKNKETVAKTEPQQPNNAFSTDSSHPTGDTSGISPAEPNGKSTVSTHKDTQSSDNTQDPVQTAIDDAVALVGEDGARQAVESTLNAKSKEIENVRKKIADAVRNVDLTSTKSRETLQKLKDKEAELRQKINTYSAALERLDNQGQGRRMSMPQGETHQAGGEDPRLVPVFTEDDPKKARGRGWRKTVSEMINRPGPVKALRGNPTSVKFSTKHTQDGVYAVVEADGLQPSHTQGQKNPYHFLDEAQPKDREGKDSVKASRDMAANINPVEITGGVTAYTGSPSINARGEVIQGNNRSDALKYMYSSEPQAAARYKQYLIDHAADFGLDAEAVARMEHPVLVNLLDVADEDAIALGQYTQADLESGGIQAISAQNAATLLANKGLFGRFANILLRGAEDEGISELVVRNGRDALVFLRNVAGAINDTQFRSAFRNDRGELTPEAKTSLADMLTRQLLGGNRSLQDMFHGLPAKAQKAIAATAFRDLQSPESERLQDELRASIVAFHALMQDPNFADATNYETARRAMEAAKRQMNTDFATGSDVAIMEKFSNFALTLAALYKGSTQKQIQATFNDIYNYVQGTWEQGLFDTGTPTPHTLEESIKHVLGIEYQPINRNKNGHTRSDNVDNDAPQGEAGGQGSPRNAASGEQGTQTEQPADSGRGTYEDSEPKPIGRGAFGDIYDQFRGKAKEAFDFLQKKKSGYLLSVFHRDDIGDIDLTWGDAPTQHSGKGLAHIIRKHVETMHDFRSAEDVFKTIEDVINNGTTTNRQVQNTYNIEKGNFRVVIAKDKEGNWVLTAFDFKNSPKNKKEGSPATLTPGETAIADGAGAVAPNLSSNKDTKNPETTQQITDAVEKLGLGVEIITSPSQLPKEEKKARESIEKGEEVKGWYNARTGKAYLYLPNAEDTADAVETVLHEVVAHKGLRGLLGKEGFDRLCDEVWDMMDAGQRRQFMAYVTRKKKMTETEFLAAVADGNKRREAADEYVAHIAESLDTEKLANESAWKKVLEAVRAFLGRIGIGRDANISDESITRLLQDSYRQLRRQKEDGNPENNIKENISKAESEVNVTPTEAQKKAGNYKKGHVRIDGYDITIEQPKGSTRSGTDENGKTWETKMNNTYGYIRGTQSVDGDHIDVFLSYNPTEGNVYVVDQIDQKTGEFDEHKVMYGFNSMEEAKNAYLSNYSKGWKIGNITEVNKEEFKKWVESSQRKTKPFSEYSSVNKQKQEEKDIKRPVAKIEDVGEKIGGARKDKVKEFAEKEKRVRENKEDVLAEIAQLPVSKMFNFDYDALRKEGESNEIVTLLQVIKSVIPSKPRTPYKLRRWVSDVFELYHGALKLITLEETEQKKIVERLKGMDGIGQRYTARMALGGYDGGFELGDARLEELGETSGHYDKEGKWVSIKGQWYVTGAGRYNGIYGTKEKAIEALRDFAGLQQKNKGDRKVEFSIYKNRATGKAFITVKGNPQIIVESGFENASDARKYLQEHYDDLVRSWSNMKTQTTIGFKEQNPRKGKDWRAGRDVSADEFRATFGFRGVEFGNWTNQQERQIALNNAYDALMDLSEATGKSPRAMSLNGELGIAFGARGSGRAMAHYEPDKIVINLTKTMGAGTLAHEWWHAMDNYFARRRGQRHKYNTDRSGYSYDRTRGTYSDEERREITDAFKELNTAIELSGYGERSKKYASLKSPYWSRPTELGARAFEAWVNRKLSEKGTINDFLATPPMAWENNGLTETYYPYPIESDFEKLDTAFENLFDTMQEKVDEETGNSALFRIGNEVATAEEHRIEEEAKANGTYMKAPNGKPTNLSPRQWAAARTAGFKDKYGDWEKVARIEKLRNSKPIDIEYNGEYDLNRDAAKKWLKENIRGLYTNADTNEQIEISKVGINEVTAHGSQDIAHLKSLSSIPKMIENSIYINEIPNAKENDKYDSYRYYVCGLNIDGEDYTAKIVVGVKGDRKYYDHRLTQIEKGNLINNLNGLSNSVAENQNAHVSDIKDKRLVSILQNNYTGRLDENGEPTAETVDEYLASQESEDDGIHFQKAAEDEIDNLRQQVNNATYDNAVDDTLPPTPQPEPGMTVSKYLKTWQQWKKEALETNKKLQADYGKEANGNLKWWRESFRQITDSARPLERLLDWAKAHGGKIDISNDAYTDMFSSAGRATYKATRFEEDLLRPMKRTLTNMARNVSLKDWAKSLKLHIEEFGEEKQLQATVYDMLSLYLRAKDIIEAAELGWVERGAQGFKDMTGMEAGDFTRRFEDIFTEEEISILWDKIKKCSDFALQTYLDEGMMTKEDYDKYSSRQFYVPQRGWAQNEYSDYSPEYVGTDKYGNSKSFNAALVKAKGRTSLAADPLQYIESIAYSAILATEKNAVKRKFLKFVRDNADLGERSQAFRMRKVWYVRTDLKDPETGKPLYERTYKRPPQDLFDKDSEIHKQISELETKAAMARTVKERKEIRGKIRELHDQINVRTKQNPNLVANKTRAEKEEHVVNIIEDNEEYEIYTNDNLVANVLNRKSAKYNLWYRGVGKATRFFTGMLTRYKPTFAFRNFIRDTKGAYKANFIEFGLKYATQMLINEFTVMPAVAHYAWTGRFTDKKGREFEGNKGKDLKLLKDFFESGAATGFTYLRDMETLEKSLRKEIERGRGAEMALASWDGLKKFLAFLTEVSETSVRFAQFKQSVMAGYSKAEAASHAKEVTTNFDRRGSHENGFLQFVVPLYGFFNASIQGVNRYYRMGWKQVALYGLTKGLSKIASLGFNSFVWGLIWTMCFPDDPDDERYFSEYDRMSNVCIGNLRIPLPHVLRGFYGAGVMAAYWIQDRKSGSEALLQGLQFLLSDLVVEQFNILDPLKYDEAGRITYDFGMLGRQVTPTAIQPLGDIAANEDFAGRKIYNENYVRSQDDNRPQTQLGMKDVNSVLQAFTNWLANVSGGSATAKTNRDIPWLFDVNPSKIEHVLENIFMPGVIGEAVGTAGLVYDAVKGNDVDISKLPFIGSFYRPYNMDRHQRSLYWKLRKKTDRYGDDMRAYRKDMYANPNSAERYNEMATGTAWDTYKNSVKLLDSVNPDKEDFSPSPESIKKLQEQLEQWYQNIE